MKKVVEIGFYIIWTLLLTNIDGAAVLSSKAFHNFDLKCLPNETVAGIACKKFISPTGTVDYELTIFCRGIAGPMDPPPMANVSTCRYAKKHHPQLDNPDAEEGCKEDEYVSGFQGTLEGGYRAIRLRCCKAMNAKIKDCQTVGPESVVAFVATGMRDPSSPRTGCPRNVLTSMTVANGKLSAKYCAVNLDGVEYKPYCSNDQSQPDNMELEKSGNKEEEEEENKINDLTSTKTTINQIKSLEMLVRLHKVIPGEETKYGQSFEMDCEYGQAISALQWKTVNGTDGHDLVYIFLCKSVTNQSQQTAIKKRVTKPVRPNATYTFWCYDNETLCGFYGTYNRTSRHKRHYTFVCCEGSNWYSTPDIADEIVIREGETVQGEYDNQYNSRIVQGITIAMSEDHQTTITAIFQSYRYEENERFLQNTTVYDFKSLKLR